jgi:hypothetical protein
MVVDALNLCYTKSHVDTFIVITVEALSADRDGAASPGPREVHLAISIANRNFVYGNAPGQPN